ncbi:hypothetical protein CFC21_022342 [Triticum aestivum]|uniref:Uncharacterized protein n=2 Tax=Triticum aestivum TaxID=4565 RepID=A0A9R1EC98_WHEAT|nr:hypothetical protein CFC21_022340 [Triticum aestivum]KAF7007397.1 hypothetical protein CFC21_022342 [Triticum aestivum]
MASAAPPAFLPQLVQLVQPVSVLPDQLMRQAAERSPPPQREGCSGAIGPTRQPPSAPAESTGGEVMVLNDASSLAPQLRPTPPGEGAGGRIHRQLAGPKRPGPPREGRGGGGGVIHAFSS